MELTTWHMGIGLLIYFTFSGLILSALAIEKQNTYAELKGSVFNVSNDITLNMSSDVMASNTISFMKSLSIVVIDDIGFFGNIIFVFLPSIFLVLFIVFLIRGL